MVSPVQRAVNGDEDKVNFVDDDAHDSPNLMKGQQAAGVKQIDIAQVGQRVFQQSADKEKEKPPLNPRKVNLRASGNVAGNRRNDPVGEKIDEIVGLVKQLKVDYESWRDNFKGEVAFQGAWLELFEYFSSNKENIAKVAKQIESLPGTEVKSWLDERDATYKCLADIPPLIAHIRKYQRLNNIQNELAKYQQQLQDLKKKFQNSDSNYNRIRKAQKFIEEHIDSSELKKEKKEAWNKGKIRAVHLISKLTSYPLEHLMGWSSTIAVKVSKIGFNFFKRIQGFWNVKKAKADQAEWLYHLQPYTVNIYSDDSNQIALEEEHKAAREKLRQEAKEFVESLNDCQTIEEVKAIFKRKGISFEISSTFEEFQEQLKNSKRFRTDLGLKYHYCVGQRAMMSETKEPKISN